MTLRIITKVLVQDAVYWPLATNSGEIVLDDYGQPQYTDPMEIKVRWSDMAVEFISPMGTREISRAKVMTGQDVMVGGCLFLGLLTDLDDQNNPKSNPNVWEIRQFKKTPTLKADQFVRTAYL